MQGRDAPQGRDRRSTTTSTFPPPLADPARPPAHALYSWARKLSQAFAGGLAGWALGAIGYQSGGVQQSDAVLDGIYGLATLFPAIIFALAGLAFAFWYPRSTKRVNDNVATLERKHADEGVQA
ncbi:MFS transporter [Brachybacterium alimentarium]